MEPADQRNILLALVLCFGLFALYNVFVLEPQQRARQQEIARSKQQAVATAPTTTQAIRPRDDIIREETAAGTRVAIDAPAVNGSVSLIGGRIDDVSLKDFYETVQDKLAKREAGEVHLLSPSESDRAFYASVNWSSANAPAGALPDEMSLWTQTGAGPLTQTNPLTLTWSSPAARIDRKIEVDQDYLFTVTDKVTNLGSAAFDVRNVAVLRQRTLPEHLKPPPNAHAGVIGVYGAERNQMRRYSDLAKSDADPSKAVKASVSAGWIGLTTKYWMGAAIPEQGEPVDMLASVNKANGQSFFQAGYALSPYTVQPGQAVTKTARIFAGAKRVSVLDRYEKDAGIPAFTDAVDWSWLFFITKPFFFLLQTFQSWFGSFGWAILALTVLVKAVFFPLQFNMYKSMSKMRKLQPEMKSIQDRFAADPQRMRLEQANLWKREKVNPLAGCLPMLPQVFVFYALYHTLMVTIEMRHTPFLGTWIQDMSAPDHLSLFNLFGLIPWNPGSVPLIGNFLMIGPFALLYGLTMVALQGMSAPPTDAMQRAIMRWIPLVFTILFAGFASGLVIYWVWSNSITLVQQYIIMRRTGVETEFDKFFKKHFGRKPPSDGGDKSARAPAE